MSRRPTKNAVSLFPFLAVLVSAMGALILLLLVTTRQLHKDAVAKAQAEKAAREAADQEAARNIIPLPLPEDHPAFQTDAAEFVITVKAPSKQLLPPTPPPDRTFEKELLRKEWEAKLASLREKWDSLQQRLRDAQRLLSEQETTDAALEAELARLQEILDKLRTEKKETESDSAKAKTDQKSIAQQIAELQAELERLKSEKAEQADKFQLVPYAGNSPTRTRPIVIECDEKTIRFASEEITLTPGDLSGFTSDYNPLRAGTDALIRYWVNQRSESGAISPPRAYVLFVIRPGGTVSYYVARRMIERLECDSGYELVPASTDLVWPQTTPEAKNTCQTAVEEVLGARRRLMAQTGAQPNQIQGELQFQGPRGEFILDEVEQMRKPEQQAFLGGQRFVRVEKSRAAGTPHYVPPQAPESTGFVGPRVEDLKDEFGRPTGPANSGKELILPRGPRGGELPKSMPPRAPGQAAGPESVGDFLGGGERVAAKDSAAGAGRPVPSQARPALGNHGTSDSGDVGRGAGEASGEATAAQGTPGQMGNLLARDGSSKRSPPLKFRPPTNELDRPLPEPETVTPAKPAKPHPLQDARTSPHGDRTEVHEATDDPSKAGEWNAEGVAGGKGTFQGQGTSQRPAPDNIPVQEGASSDPLAARLPPPLPEPPPRSMAAERYVVVTIDSSTVKFGRHEIPIDPSDGSYDLGSEFSQQLSQQVDHWGRPPKGFHWQPALRFRVRPGGNQYYAWLQSATAEWGLKSSVEYVFD